MRSLQHTALVPPPNSAGAWAQAEGPAAAAAAAAAAASMSAASMFARAFCSRSCTSPGRSSPCCMRSTRAVASGRLQIQMRWHRGKG